MLHPPAERVSAPRAIRLEYLLGLLTALGPLTIDMYLPALPTIAADLGVDVSLAELTLAIYFAGFAIGQLLVGPALDLYGRTRPLVFGLALYALGTLGCALASTLPLLVAARFVQALGGAVVVVVPRAIVRDLHSGADAARAMSRLILVMGIAPIVAPLLGGALLPAGWRTIFFVLLGVAAAALAVSRLIPETHRPAPTRTPFRKVLGALLTEPDFLAFTAVGGFAMAAMFAYIASSSHILIELHGVDPAHYGFYFGANAASFITMSQVTRLLLRRWTPLTIVRSAMFVLVGAAAIIFTATTGGVGGLPLLMVGLTLYLGALGTLAPNATALALEHHGPRAGLASAVMGSAQSALAAFAAFAVSAAHDGTDAPLGVVMVACLGLSAVVLVFHVLRGRGDGNDARTARSAA